MRKHPIRHKVNQHTRAGNPVSTHNRGQGSRTFGREMHDYIPKQYAPLEVKLEFYLPAMIQKMVEGPETGFYVTKDGEIHNSEGVDLRTVKDLLFDFHSHTGIPEPSVSDRSLAKQLGKDYFIGGYDYKSDTTIIRHYDSDSNLVKQFDQQNL